MSRDGIAKDGKRKKGAAGYFHLTNNIYGKGKQMILSATTSKNGLGSVHDGEKIFLPQAAIILPYLCCIVSMSQFSTFRAGRRISITAGGVEVAGGDGGWGGALPCLAPKGVNLGLTFSWPKETERCTLDG